jgi:hypothetical protein
MEKQKMFQTTNQQNFDDDHRSSFKFAMYCGILDLRTNSAKLLYVFHTHLVDECG